MNKESESESESVTGAVTGAAARVQGGRSSLYGSVHVRGRLAHVVEHRSVTLLHTRVAGPISGAAELSERTSDASTGPGAALK